MYGINGELNMHGVGLEQQNSLCICQFTYGLWSSPGKLTVVHNLICLTPSKWLDHLHNNSDDTKLLMILHDSFDNVSLQQDLNVATLCME